MPAIHAPCWVRRKGLWRQVRLQLPLIKIVSSVRACLESVPFDPEVRDATVTAAENTLALYTFRDTSIQWDTPPFEIDVDLPKELKKLGSKTFDNDYAVLLVQSVCVVNH